MRVRLAALSNVTFGLFFPSESLKNLTHRFQCAFPYLSSGAVVYLEEFENFQTGELCSLKFVGKPLFNIPVALPCTPHVEAVMSYFITSERTNGNIASWMPDVPNVRRHIA